MTSVKIPANTNQIGVDLKNEEQKPEENTKSTSKIIAEEDDSVPFFYSFLESFYDQFSFNDGIITWLTIVLFAIAWLYFSILLGLFVVTLLLIFLFSRWFKSTQMSVEITVFLAKFFPPSKNAVWDCHTTPELAWTQTFRDNYSVILGEALAFMERYNYCPEMDDVYPNGAITNWDRKWPTITLRVYGLDTKISKYFPKTMAMVNSSPLWLSHVMYSILKPHKYIPRHRGPYRGVLRYQLALEIPHCKNPNEGLYLAVWPDTSSHIFWPPENVPEGEPDVITWTNGEDFLFDDTCVHEVDNTTACRRIILFMDVERFDIPFFSKILHKFFMSMARFLPAVQIACNVQDRYLEECRDKETDELKKWTGIVNENRILENNWMWYSTPPEILPYRKARVVINARNKAKIKK